MLALQPKGDAALGFMDRNMAQPFNDKGEFIMSHVTPGSYTLTATVNDDGKMLSARLPLEVGASSIEDITLQPAPGLDIARASRRDSG